MYEHHLMSEIDLCAYEAGKAVCNKLLLKMKNAYATYWHRVGTGEAKARRVGTARQPQGSIQGDFRCGHADHRTTDQPDVSAPH